MAVMAVVEVTAVVEMVEEEAMVVEVMEVGAVMAEADLAVEMVVELLRPLPQHLHVPLRQALQVFHIPVEP